jgi:plasmid segregation protein ParM
MIQLNDGRCIIGFDNGYQFGKTANIMFDNGVYPLGRVEPSVTEHSLKYERRYYKVGEGRAAITEDKVSDENARLLTMVAAARELSAAGMTKAEVILAVGLPFSDYGREKKDLVRYYEQKPVMKYEYEGVRYDVTISRTFAFPQCYSAIAQRLCNMKGDYLVVDVGSKTTDVVFLKDGHPVESRSVTIEKAMVKWLRQIQGSLQVQFGKNIPENEILRVVLKESSSLPKSYVNHIRKGMTEQIEMLKLELAEREYDLEYTNVIYVGGGAAAVKNFSEYKDNVAYDCDILANAKGYEFLASQMMRKQGVV